MKMAKMGMIASVKDKSIGITLQGIISYVSENGRRAAFIPEGFQSHIDILLINGSYVTPLMTKVTLKELQDK